MKPKISILALALVATTAAAQTPPADRLENSPRHHEWAAVPAGDRSVYSFVAYPESPEPTLAVIVIHENRGLTDWVRSFADQVAEAGYLAIAPDLLSEFDGEHTRTSDFPTADAARDALYQLDPDQVRSDLLAVQEYAAGLPASTGQTVVAGFCWGGAQAFRMATYAPHLSAAMVFYGSPPDSGALSVIDVPVYAFYGGEDARINATIPETAERMNALEKVYDYEIYDGAGHAFMRSGAEPDAVPANRAAHDAAWARLIELLGAI